MKLKAKINRANILKRGKEYYDGRQIEVKNAICCHCGKMHTWDVDSCAIYKGKFVCEDCYQDYYGYCNGCGELYKYSEMNDEIVCGGCEIIGVE